MIHTQRLILRNFIPQDLDNFYEYAKEKGLGEMAGWHHHKNIAETEQILNDFCKKQHVYAIVFEDKVVGSIDIRDVYYKDSFGKIQKEIGYVLSKKYQSKGLATEATQGIIKYTFENLSANSIFCWHKLNNYKSKNVIKKCGFSPYIYLKKIDNISQKKLWGMLYIISKNQ